MNEKRKPWTKRNPSKHEQKIAAMLRLAESVDNARRFAAGPSLKESNRWLAK